MGQGPCPALGALTGIHSHHPLLREEKLAQRLLIVFSRSFISRFAHLSSTTASCHLHQPRAWHCLNAPICSLFQLFKKNKIILSPTQTCITPALLGEIHLNGETPPDSCAAELSTRAFLSSYYHKARAACKQDFKSSDSHQ